MDTSEKRRVLVIEPDPAIRALIVALLRREGYTTDAVDSARAALQVHRGSVHAAVVVDPRMPGGDLLLAALRADGGSAKVIVVTTPDWREPVYPHGDGVHGVLLKPFHLEELADMIGSCFDGGASSAEQDGPDARGGNRGRHAANASRSA